MATLFQKGDEQRDEDHGPSVAEVETIIGPSVHVEGNFVGQGDVIVEGSVTGTLKTTRNLRVGENAVIQADIQAQTALVSGHVEGQLTIKDKIELTSTARIKGDIRAGEISIDSGAIIHGRCECGEKIESTKATGEMERVADGKDKKSKK